MPRKPLEPDDRLRNCLPMASGRGGTTREPVKKEIGRSRPTVIQAGACRLSTATRSPAEGPRARQAGTPARIWPSQLR
jgi:hypothetical protein